MLLAALLALQIAAADAWKDPSSDRGLVGGYNDRNPFAKVIRGELPVHKIYEDAHVLAFVSPRQTSPGHCLVISKSSRARNITEVEPAELSRVMAVVQKVARAERDALGAEGVWVRQNNGSASGQTVFHMHFHVVPRWAGREPLPGEIPLAPDAELAAVQAKLVSVLRRR